MALEGGIECTKGEQDFREKRKGTEMGSEKERKWEVKRSENGK